MTDRAGFNDTGDLIIPKKKLGTLGDLSPELIRILRISGDLLLSASTQAGNRKHPIFYGDLRLFHVAELLALISSMGKEGVLTLLVPHARKAIYFNRGHVVHGASSVEDDRLGEILWRKGMITLEQLGEVLDLVKPGSKLGKLLMDRGLITPRQLYEGIQQQILEIVYSTFHFIKGEFIFEERKLDKKYLAPPELTTRELIQEGLSRLDELTKLDNIFADRKTVLCVRPLHLDVELDEHELHIRGLVDSKRTVEQILETSRMGELETLRTLSRLLNTGQIDREKPKDAKRKQDAQSEDFVQDYAYRIKIIYHKLKAFDTKAIDRLNAYLSIPTKRYKKIFKNVLLNDEGELDLNTLRQNIRHLDDGQELALAALTSFYDYSRFQAMDVLDDKSCDELLTQLEEE